MSDLPETPLARASRIVSEEQDAANQCQACSTCSGEGTVIETRPLANSNYRPCPDCTPENVEEPTMSEVH